MIENLGLFLVVMVNRDGICNIFIYYEISEWGFFGKLYREIVLKLIV